MGAIGADKIVLAGVSYGTEVALAYAARYPAHVDRLVLDSIVPLDQDTFHRETYQALDNCARVQRDQHVLLLCAVDGLYGGRNLIDEQAVSWIQAGIQQRGAHATVMWTDMPLHPDVYWSRTSDAIPAWDLPAVVKGAMAGADLVINQLIDYWTEGELRDRVPNYFYNMATTSRLLSSAWALTPWELVAEIRIRAAAMVTPGAPWRITHPNGTDVRGKVNQQLMPRYGDIRYGPFPEGVFPSLGTTGAEGEMIFDRMGPHWARHVGVPLRFSAPVHMTLQDGKVKEIRVSPGQAVESGELLVVLE